MPEVYFVGSIDIAQIDGIRISSEFQTSVTWAIVPGNNSWSQRFGATSGETQICDSVIAYIYIYTYFSSILI